jgi:hypothetical protein
MDERTKREIAAGVKVAARHAAQQMTVQQNRKSDVRHGVTPWTYPTVFRPIDYVPDQAKGQGYIKVTS